MLLRRGADANREDKNSCVPAFMARKNRYLECRQIINQYLRERNERLAQEAANVSITMWDVPYYYGSKPLPLVHCTAR